MKWRLLAAALGIATLLGAAAPLAAQGDTPTLKVNEPTRTSTRGLLALSATLTGPDGGPVADQEVAFFQQVELFGPREARLGSATTDSSGAAILLYQPATRGHQTIKATFDGSERFARASASTTVEVRDVTEPYETEPEPLATLRQWLPAALSSVVVGVWALVLGVLWRAVLSIRAIGRTSR